MCSSLMDFCVTNIQGQPVYKAILSLCADLSDTCAKECKRHTVDYCKQRAQHVVAVLKNNDTHRSLTKLFIFISMVFTCSVYMYTSQWKKGVDQNFIILLSFSSRSKVELHLLLC